MAGYISKFATGATIEAILDKANNSQSVSAAEKQAWNGKQNALTFDNTPTNGSSNPVKSGGVYAALGNKVDKENGKGLSTNDFTNEDKAQITTNKNNILKDKAALVELVDAGAKNLLKNVTQSQTVGGVTFTLAQDGSITANGTKTDNNWLYLSMGNTLPAGSYVLSSGLDPQENSSVRVLVATADSLGAVIISTEGQNQVVKKTFSQSYSGLIYAIRISSGYTVSNLVFKPMLCTAEAYAISSEFVPYGMTNAELTQSVKPIPRLVDAGAKNLFSVNAVIFSGQGTGDTFPVNIPAGDYIFSCNCSATTSTSHLYFFDKNGTELLHQPFTNNNNKKISITFATQVAFARVDSDVQNTISNIMFCTAEAYAISPEFVPYAPTNRELYEMILALQSGS